MRSVYLQVLLVLCAAAATAQADFPQWRGPDRNGVADAEFSAEWNRPPEPLWTSDQIPGDSDGGFASVSVAGDKVYVFVNDKYGIAFAHRKLDRRTFDRLGGKILDLPGETLKAVEAIRTSEKLGELSGKQRNEYVDQQVEKIFADVADSKKLARAARDRLRRGGKATPLAELKSLQEIVNRRFETQAKLEAWLDAQEISEQTQKELLKRIETEKKAAKDRIVCLDAATGKRIWQKEYQGRHRGWATSSTPCIQDRKLYVGGSGGNVYCLDAETGKEIWLADTGDVEINSSPAVIDGKVFIQANRLLALDAGDGKILYEIKEARGRDASPVAWESNGDSYVLTNASGKLFCVAPADGRVLWTAPAGGRSSPTVLGETCAILTDKKDKGLIAYKLTPQRAEKLWSVEGIRDRGASCVLHDGFAYAFTKSEGICVQISSGKTAWKGRVRGGEFSSPVVADGKILALLGRNVEIYKASPVGGMQKLAGARINPLRCTSPAVADGKLFVRTKNNIVCYPLAK
jgi:outer membrane protein assembly factor BamB